MENLSDAGIIQVIFKDVAGTDDDTQNPAREIKYGYSFVYGKAMPTIGSPLY